MKKVAVTLFWVVIAWMLLNVLLTACITTTGLFVNS
jgi:hypothetical protein